MSRGRNMNIRENFPPVVYLPCAAEVSTAVAAAVQCRTTCDGRSAVLVNSELDRSPGDRASTHSTCLEPTLPGNVCARNRGADCGDRTG